MKTFSTISSIMWGHFKEEEDPLRSIAFVLFSFIGIIATTFFGWLAVLNNDIVLASLDFVSAFILLTFVTAVLYLRTSNIFISFSAYFIATLFFVLLVHGGDNNTSFFWFFIYPILSIFFLGSSKGLVASFLLGVGGTIFFFFESTHPELKTAHYSTAFYLRFLFCYFVILAFSYILGKLIENQRHLLSEANHNLEEQIWRRTKELQETNTNLERFIYTISHDLKSPLVTISGFSGMAKEEISAGDIESSKRTLEVVSKAANRMQQLIGELLSLSRVGVKIDPNETVSLRAIINDAAEITSGVLSENNTTLDVEPELPDVTVDRKYFAQVIENLLTNASRYSRSAKEGSQVKIGVVKDAEELTLYVKDNGIGIEEKYLGKIFGLFEKLETDTESTGVGLAIVKRIIEKHGGKIWAESEGIGKGTTFFFTLSEVKS